MKLENKKKNKKKQNKKKEKKNNKNKLLYRLQNDKTNSRYWRVCVNHVMGWYWFDEWPPDTKTLKKPSGKKKGTYPAREVHGHSTPAGRGNQVPETNKQTNKQKKQKQKQKQQQKPTRCIVH